MAAVARVLRGSMFLMSPAAGTAAGAKAAGAKAAGAAAAKKKTKAASTKPRAPSGITKPMPVSDEFSRFAGGASEVARSQAMKLVWAHIKAHGLQNRSMLQLRVELIFVVRGHVRQMNYWVASASHTCTVGPWAPPAPAAASPWGASLYSPDPNAQSTL